jgi:hypothetical protein
MKHGTWILIAAVAAMASGVQAASTTVTLLPGAAVNTSGNAGTSAPGFGTGSWQAPGAGAKQEAYVPVGALFSGSVTIDDIASISYWTNKGTTAADVDWTFLIYTAKTGSGDTGSFYHSRLNSEPYFTNTPSVTANTWHEWSTNDPSNPMTFYDQARSGNFGTYADPTLGDLQAGSVTWANNAQYDYGSDTVSLFSLQTGSAWSNGFTGLVDGVTITLKNGDVGRINLEAVPAPASVVGGLALLGGLGLVSALKRVRHQIA